MRAWASTALLGLSLLTFACSTDDEDRLDAFVTAVTGQISEQRVDHVLATYVDLDLEAIDVSALGDSKVYQASDKEKLKGDAHRRLSRLYGRSLNVLRRAIEQKNDHAFVRLQLFSQEGMGNVTYELDKHGERWIISSVAVNQ